MLPAIGIFVNSRDALKRGQLSDILAPEGRLPMWLGTSRRLIIFAAFAGVTSWAQDGSGDRQSYADKIRATYNFRFGPGKISALRTLTSKAGTLFNRKPSCRLPIADGVTRKPIASGGRRCTPTPFERPFTEPASTFWREPRVLSSRATAIAAITPLECSPGRLPRTQRWTVASTKTV
jgi:hypothetical protein